MASGLPDPKMLQNLLDDRLVLDDADHPHFALAFWAYQWVYFVHLLYQPRPIPAKFRSRQARVNQCRHVIFLAGSPAQAARFIAVVSIIPDSRHGGTSSCRGYASLAVRASLGHQMFWTFCRLSIDRSPLRCHRVIDRLLYNSCAPERKLRE
jgi:hypothetical protein